MSRDSPQWRRRCLTLEGYRRVLQRLGRLTGNADYDFEPNQRLHREVRLRPRSFAAVPRSAAGLEALFTFLGRTAAAVVQYFCQE